MAKDDVIIQMELDYGRIRIEYEQIEGSAKSKRVLKCTKCPYQNTEKVG